MKLACLLLVGISLSLPTCSSERKTEELAKTEAKEGKRKVQRSRGAVVIGCLIGGLIVISTMLSWFLIAGPVGRKIAATITANLKPPS